MFFCRLPTCPCVYYTFLPIKKTTFRERLLLISPEFHHILRRNTFRSNQVNGNLQHEKEIELRPGTELRIEVENRETVHLQLKSGYADILGSELKIGTPYEFKAAAKISVFTHQGCELLLQANENKTYINKGTTLGSYLKYHRRLEVLREYAERNNTRGPVTVVVGPQHTGKSTVCRILLNNAVRARRTPIFVNLDVGQSHISIPGTIGAMTITQPAPVQEDFFQQSSPVVLHYGHINLQENAKLFDTIVSQLAQKVHEQLEDDSRVKFSGVVVNTLGWVKNRGYLHLLHVIRAFQADNVVVMDDVKLAYKLTRDLSPNMTVTRLLKNTNIGEKNSTIRVENRRHQVPPPQLNLPFGPKTKDYALMAVTVQPDASILHHVLAVSNMRTLADEVHCTVVDFVAVTKVDAERQKLTILSPRQEYSGDNYLLLSDVKLEEN